MVFLNSLFFAGGPKDEPPSITGPTFPLTLNDRLGSDANWQMNTEALGGCWEKEGCTGHIIPGIQQQVWCQTLKLDSKGSTWGGRPGLPTGLNRSPTFVGYGWNNVVAQQLEIPTLVMQGLNDTGVPTGTPGTAQTMYKNLAATDKVLVLVECASHALPWEGCSGTRCTPTMGTPYGDPPWGGAAPWAGPHATLKAALIEWIKEETFSGEPRGSWTINQSGVASGPT